MRFPPHAVLARALSFLVLGSACSAPVVDDVSASGAAASQSPERALGRLESDAQFVRRIEKVAGEEQEDFFFERSRMQQIMTVLASSPESPRGSAACGAPRFSLEFLDGGKKKIGRLDVCSELRTTSVLETARATSSFTIDPSLLSAILQAPTARELTFGVTSVVARSGARLEGNAATDFVKSIELDRSSTRAEACLDGAASTTSGLPTSFDLDRGRRRVGTLVLDCGAVPSSKALASLTTLRKTHAVTVDLATLKR